MLWFSADLKLDIGRPIWIDIDLDLLKRLICFTTDLWPRERETDLTESTSQPTSGVRSMAVSTNYVACTLIAGGSHDSAPSVKLSSSSFNLGVSFKAQDEGNPFRLYIKLIRVQINFYKGVC